MALTPEDIKAVQFGTVKMKSGYDMEDVDAFLDTVELELGRLLAENASLKEQLRILESPPLDSPTAPVPVVAQEQASPSEHAVRILDLAQKTADDTIAAAKVEADRIVGDAQARRAELDTQEAQFRSAFQSLLEENLAKLGVRPTAWSSAPSDEDPGL